jgi:hypothetical protein
MDQLTAAALARHMLRTRSTVTRAGIEAALREGGYDPETVEPDSPRTYIERACSDARAVNPAYLSPRELDALMQAREDALGGHPF